MFAVFERCRTRIDQAQVSFMYQAGGIERSFVGSFSQSLPRQCAQLRVDERNKLVEGFFLARSLSRRCADIFLLQSTSRKTIEPGDELPVIKWHLHSANATFPSRQALVP